MSYTETGKIMSTNESSIRSLVDKRQISVPVEEDTPVCEVMLAMDSLANRISVALIAADNLKERLYLILPPESKNEETKYIEDNIKQSEFSCPLTKELETDCCKIDEITKIIHYLLENLKL